MANYQRSSIFIKQIVHDAKTANMFRNMLGLPWEDKQGEQEQEANPQDDLDVKQSTLSDFID
jgi:hypothetical protein